MTDDSPKVRKSLHDKFLLFSRFSAKSWLHLFLLSTLIICAYFWTFSNYFNYATNSRSSNYFYLSMSQTLSKFHKNDPFFNLPLDEIQILRGGISPYILGVFNSIFKEPTVTFFVLSLVLLFLIYILLKRLRVNSIAHLVGPFIFLMAIRPADLGVIAGSRLWITLVFLPLLYIEVILGNSKLRVFLYFIFVAALHPLVALHLILILPIIKVFIKNGILAKISYKLLITNSIFLLALTFIFLRPNNPIFLGGEGSYFKLPLFFEVLRVVPNESFVYGIKHILSFNRWEIFIVSITFIIVQFDKMQSKRKDSQKTISSTEDLFLTLAKISLFSWIIVFFTPLGSILSKAFGPIIINEMFQSLGAIPYEFTTALAIIVTLGRIQSIVGFIVQKRRSGIGSKSYLALCVIALVLAFGYLLHSTTQHRIIFESVGKKTSALEVLKSPVGTNCVIIAKSDVSISIPFKTGCFAPLVDLKQVVVKDYREALAVRAECIKAVTNRKLTCANSKKVYFLE